MDDQSQKKFESIEQALEELKNAMAVLPARVSESLNQKDLCPQPQAGNHTTAYRQPEKDVLGEEEEITSKSSTNGKLITPEIQVQRLTAQLTAAYNRIAALEEQLLSRRISHRSSQ
jgi:hypothetical protein